MAVIPTPEQGKPILDFSEGTFDGSSYLFQSRNGATEHVSGDDVADYVNTSRIYNTLDTESKKPISAINEVNAAIDEVAEAVDGLSAVSSFTPTSVYGIFSFKAINGIKCLKISDLKGLAAESMTILDFTLPQSMIPIDAVVVFEMRIPSSTYTIRVRIQTDGVVKIYNYGTNTGALNMSCTECYI